MSFEPFGYGNRWYDRLGGHRLKSKEFAGLLLIAGVLIGGWHFFG